MTRDEARRASMLSDALEVLEHFYNTTMKPPEVSDDQQIVLKLQVFECGADPYDGGVGHAQVVIDLDTAFELLPQLDALIRKELDSLGVETADVSTLTWDGYDAPPIQEQEK